jgi:hypothetical protein
MEVLVPPLRYSWRGRVLSPIHVERALGNGLEALADILEAAALAAGDGRWETTVARLRAAARRFTGGPVGPLERGELGL